MMVKIGNRIFKSSEQPIAVLLEGDEDKCLEHLDPNCKVFCIFPDVLLPSESDIYEVQQYLLTAIAEFSELAKPKEVSAPTKRPIISVLYTEFQPETYAGISILEDGRESIINTGDFDADFEKARQVFAPFLVSSSVDHFITDSQGIPRGQRDV